MINIFLNSNFKFEAIMLEYKLFEIFILKVNIKESKDLYFLIADMFFLKK